jgi:hypothetical protein
MIPSKNTYPQNPQKKKKKNKRIKKYKKIEIIYSQKSLEI